MSHSANTIPTCLGGAGFLGEAGLGWEVEMPGERPVFSSPLLAQGSRTGLVMDRVVTPKPRLCPLCAAGEELCHVL